MQTRARRPNRVRIIGGTWRSRVIRFPGTGGLRPTPDRVRETLFNWLGQDLSGRRCLDLYAGSGALGFEALSRGAASVTMVERDTVAFRALKESARALGAANLDLVHGDALEFAAHARAGFDIVFLDPPFAEGVPDAVWPLVLERLAEGGMVYFESASKFPGRPGFDVLKYGQAGAVHYHLLGRKT